MEYLCAWEIHVSADSPEEAATLADRYMREQKLDACWTVTDENGDTKNLEVTIDN